MTAEHNPHAGDHSQSGIVGRPEGEIVFRNAGNSHFSYVEDKGFHVTTQVPGFGAKEGFAPSEGLSLHDPVDFSH